MNIFLSIAKDYHAYPALTKLTGQLKLDKFIISNKMNPEHLQTLRGQYELEVVNNAKLFNIIRTDVSLIILCTDGEDPASLYLTKHAILHRIPLLILSNLVDHDAILEIY